MKKVKDTQTLDLFAIPTVEVVIPGESQYAREVSEIVSRLLAESGIKDRYTLSAEVSRLADKDVSKHMLDAYCSPARLDHALPFWLAPILETVCSGHHLTNWLVAKRGGRVISIQVDDYRPAEDEFKIEEFGVRRSYIYAPASRSNWKEAYRLARRLANNGMAQGNEHLLILPTVILLGGE